MTQKLLKLEKRLTDHNHNKYITTPEFNTSAAVAFDATLAQANLMIKTDFDAKLRSQVSVKKFNSNKIENLLVENELKKLKIFDSSYFRGKSHFEEDGTQHYLVFQPINRYFKVIDNTKYISSWKSKGLSDETIKPLATSDNSLFLLIDYLGNKLRVEFSGGCLKQPNKFTYTHRAIVNIYIVYEFGTSSSFSDEPTLQND